MKKGKYIIDMMFKIFEKNNKTLTTIEGMNFIKKNYLEINDKCIFDKLNGQDELKIDFIRTGINEMYTKLSFMNYLENEFDIDIDKNTKEEL